VVVVVAVVEDDPSILDATQLVLESLGWQACPYATAEAFLTDLEGGKAFDCVLLDPHLPGKSGAEVARGLADSGIPVLVFTARPDSPLTIATARYGANAVFTKPVDAAALTDAIEALVYRPRAAPSAP
jgi:FixJ family two-component response regulator